MAVERRKRTEEFKREAVYAFWHRLVERDALCKINDVLRTEIRLEEAARRRT